MNELKLMFGDVPGIKKKEIKKYTHGVDKSLKSSFTNGGYTFKTGDSIKVECNDYSKEYSEKKDNLPDLLYVSIDSKEFSNFLMSGEAY